MRVNLRHLAQKGVLEPAATQEARTERDVLRRIRIDVARDRIDPIGQRREVARDPKRLSAAVCIRRQNDAIVATSRHQQVGGAVHRDLAGTAGMGALRGQPVLDHAQTVRHRLGVRPRHLAVSSLQLLAKTRTSNVPDATGLPARSRWTARAARQAPIRSASLWAGIATMAARSGWISQAASMDDGRPVVETEEGGRPS